MSSRTFEEAPICSYGASTHQEKSELSLQELILFSRADLERSIPSMVDGLKPGQRKILFACLKKGLKSDIKVQTPFCPLSALYVRAKAAVLLARQH